MLKHFISLILVFFVSDLALAHGPTRQKVIEAINIKASPDAVWAKLKDFNGMTAWHPAVVKSAATDGNNVGSERTLTLKDGGKVVETLEAYSDTDKKFSYRAHEHGALPVSNYTSTISVKAGDGGLTLVEWRGAFYRAYPNNDPPPGQDDETAVKAITDVYKTGLANLKNTLEQ